MEVTKVSEEQLRTVPEVCEALRIRPTKVWEFIKTGRLEVVRLGNRCTRIKKSSLDRLIKDGVPPAKTKRRAPEVAEMVT